MNKTTESKKIRLQELDSLRGIAALAVVLFHYTTGYSGTFHHGYGIFWEFSLGYLGVQLFFIISGFVIFLTLENTKKPMEFVVSRFSRLYPTYWAAIFLTLACISLYPLPSYNISVKDIMLNLTMLQYWIPAKNIDSVYWTLGVELSFYILAFFVFLMKQQKNVDILIVCWLLLAIITKLTYYPHRDFISKLLIFNYCQLFSAGICFYHIKNNGVSLKKNIILILCLLTQLIVSTVTETVSITLFFIIFYLFVLNKLSLLRNKVLFYLGTISYSLYLIHQNIGYILIENLSRMRVNPYVILASTVIAVISIASFITFFIEKPSMRFIRKTYAKYSV